MIKGFEKITSELSQEEIDLVPTIVKGLSTKLGKDNAITSTKICKAVNITGPRLRKIINHIRIKNLLPALCSTSSGYFVAIYSKFSLNLSTLVYNKSKSISSGCKL